MAKPETLEEFYKLAQADVAAGRPDAAVKWAFMHACAAADLALAERELRRLEEQERDCRMHTLMHTPGSPPDQIIMQHAPGELAVDRRRGEYLKALEKAKATELVLDLLRQPRQQRAEAPSLRAVNGGRK